MCLHPEGVTVRSCRNTVLILGLVLVLGTCEWQSYGTDPVEVDLSIRGSLNGLTDKSELSI